jgi:RNA ligase (TIGR02306 family)
MDRKLASIRKISEINPIEGADMIEVATVSGWKLVTKKGEYKPGDLAIYCEIDSFLPIREEFEFLRKSSYKKMTDGTEGFRLKTIRLRGQISQGLLLPISILPNEVISSTGFEDLEGLDVSEALGIIKYEPPIPAELSGKIKGNFPSFIKKTDEERVQNIPDVIERYKGDKFYVTEKLDGSSATFYFRDEIFGVCSRNLELAEPEPFQDRMIMCDDGIERPAKENSFWKVARELDIANKLKSTGKNICIQGELIGEGIQGNPYKIKGQTVRFYNAFDIDKYEYFAFEDFISLMAELNLETVPVLDTDYILPESIESILNYADGKSVLNNSFNREGVVLRTKNTDRISFKAISNIFLLGEKD